VFIVPLQEEFGWQTAEISSALALRLAAFGLLGPFAATSMNRFGVRSPNGADYARVEALPAEGLCAKRPRMIRFGPLVDHARAQRKGAVRRAGLTSARAGSTMPPVVFVGRSQRETDQ
jgi:hypothetical protein